MTPKSLQSRLKIAKNAKFGSTEAGKVIEIERRKVKALLIYLAVTGQPQQREKLASLFWPDSDQRRALGSLRRHLFEINKLIKAEALVINREIVWLKSSTAIWLDVAEFEQRLATCQNHDHVAEAVCAECIDLLNQATELYRGDFLTGFTLRDSAEFDDWQYFEGENLRRALASALARLVNGHSARDEYELAIHFARRWLSLEPLHEPVHQHLMRLYASAGQLSAALRQFEECVQVLEQELGVPPDDATTALFEKIRTMRHPPPSRAKVDKVLPSIHQDVPLQDTPVDIPTNLPRQTTSFVGREDEVNEIIRLLTNESGCQLLTLIGPGGMGKTRLALEVATQLLDQFTDGVFFVSLAGVSDPQFLIPAIAEALGISLTGKVEPTLQVANYLRRKQILLILDNFEHLLDSADLLPEILMIAEQAKLLVTSRERLNLHEEWLLTIEGLSYPQVRMSMTGEDYGAISLFAQRARRVQTDFDLEAEWSDVVKICHLVEGMPLGIELAAAWVRMMSCDKIAQELTQSLDILTSSLRNVPDRHRNLRAVFSHSWQLLSEDERKVFRRLSIFRGGFSQQAAKQVTEATLPNLSNLMDKSLLRRTRDGRYQVHELLRQYAAEALAAVPIENEQIRDRHSAFYAHFLQHREKELLGKAHRGALDAVMGELDNILTSWTWTVAHARTDRIEQSMRGLFCIYRLQGPFIEGEAQMRNAIKQIEPQVDRSERNILGKLLGYQAYFLNEQAKYEEAMESAQAAIRLVENKQASDVKAENHLELGRSYWFQGEYDAARFQLQQALAQKEHTGIVETDCLRFLGHTCVKRGDYSKAKVHFEQSLHSSRAIGYRDGEGGALNGLGLISRQLGDTNEAKFHFEQAREIFRASSYQQGESATLLNLGLICSQQGDWISANAHYEQAIVIYRQMGDLRSQALSLNNLGLAAIEQGDHCSAKADLEKALRLSCQIGDRQTEGQTLSNYAYFYLVLGGDKDVRKYSKEALSIAQDIGDSWLQGFALTYLGHAYRGLRQLDAAAEVYQQAIDIRRALGEHQLIPDDLAGLACVALAQNKPTQAQEYVTEILNHLNDNTLTGTDEPLRIYLTCYQVLKINKDDRAGEILDTAYQLLQERAAKIKDAEMRNSFLENVVVHRKILHQFAQTRR